MHAASRSADPCRTEYSDELFEVYAGEKESVVTNELYVTLDQLKTMIGCGMYIGSHGVFPPDNRWPQYCKTSNCHHTACCNWADHFVSSPYCVGSASCAYTAVGKTTLAVNLICEALAGTDVLLVDGDEQGTARVFTEVRAETRASTIFLIRSSGERRFATLRLPVFRSWSTVLRMKRPPMNSTFRGERFRICCRYRFYVAWPSQKIPRARQRRTTNGLRSSSWVPEMKPKRRAGSWQTPIRFPLNRNIKTPWQSEVFRRTMGQVSRNHWATVSPQEKRRRAQKPARARWSR